MDVFLNAYFLYKINVVINIAVFHRCMRGFLGTGALPTLTKLSVKVKVKVKVFLCTVMEAHQVQVQLHWLCNFCARWTMIH
jgi:hypothetical protein